MERNYQITASAFVHPDELNLRTAFHEAGHAAAIHLGNRQKQLPPVFFEIQIQRSSQQADGFSAKIVDGNLIQNLPMAVADSFSDAPCANRKYSCQLAFEADVTNLLVGPMAEAKYVAWRDGEIFSRDLLALDALRHYGGHSDLEQAQYYLEYFITSKKHREIKLRELLDQAYRFVSSAAHWRCISGLAHFIVDSRQAVVGCDEAIEIFERCLLARESARWPLAGGRLS